MQQFSLSNEEPQLESSSVATGSQAEDAKIKQTSLFRLFFVIAYVVQSAWSVLFNLPLCVRKRS